MAMFNIEMIGTTSKWGTNSAYITGYEKTDMGKILQQNLKGSGFEFYPDPYAAENLFTVRIMLHLRVWAYLLILSPLLKWIVNQIIIK